MPFPRYLDSFNIYIIVLIISLGNAIEAIVSFSLLKNIFYLFIHFLLIYLGIYYQRVLLIFIFFITGLILDLSLVATNFGAHIFTFMILILLLYKINKFLFNYSSKNILFFIIFILAMCLFIEEMYLHFMLINHSFNLNNYLQNILISLLISYPIFFLFKIIDEIN
mgnify:CR=1 FL=1